MYRKIKKLILSYPQGPHSTLMMDRTFFLIECLENLYVKC